MKVYDIESLKNFFCVVFVDLETDEQDYFEISPWRHDREALVEYCRKERGLWGFNNKGYDQPVLEYVLSTACRAEDIYEFSQKVITGDGTVVTEQRDRQIRERLRFPKQADVFRMLHFDRFGVS